jgi:LysR family transcriptional regulator, nitrogen assimilation regulatory protein
VSLLYNLRSTPSLNVLAAARELLWVVAVQTNSMNLQKQFVRRGHGWTILPGAGVAADLAAGVLSAAPLSEPEVWRSIVVGVPRTGPITPAVKAVAAQLTRQVKIAVRQGWWLSAELYEPAGG